MKALASLALPSSLWENLCIVSPRLQFHAKNNHSVQPLAFAFLNRNASLRFSASLQVAVEAVRFDGPVVDTAEFEDEDCEVVIEMCITRTLQPAVTLETGIQRIKDAVEELKLNPPPSSSGVFRFQIAVPPSPKALIWFCSQPESCGVFPQFFASNDTDNPSCNSLFLNGTRGVFGIGAAIYFVHSNSSVLCKQSSVKSWQAAMEEEMINLDHNDTQGINTPSRRYLSSDSIILRTYGFMDVSCDTDSSTINHEAGSSFFLIPEIELEENLDVSILSVTLAWDDAFSCTFKQAIQSFESAIRQVGCQFLPNTDRLQINSIRSALRKVNLVKAKSFQMVYTNALLLEKKDCQVDPLEQRSTTDCCQFCFKLSPTSGVSSIMLDLARETCFSLQDHANINAVWASIIVEECTRLGLMYFCVAPGSRSSPLAIAASTHHLITCIPCFDERSLAFHAVGYARGSHKPAVIITTSGTAVSNLLPAVVEASQDFVPLVLLTADRPPELHDVGANQAINQVNHFGSFTRYSCTLPPPTDKIPARMVLTTIDSAVHWATSSPCGPVHINCPFREPLDDSPKKWMVDCLKGLNIWMSGCQPLTKYIQTQNSLGFDGHSCGLLAEVLEIIQQSKRGLLLVGAIHSEDETWAALLLAKHLNWPVVADVLSGLRLRKLLSSFPEVGGNMFFIDHLDHALLSDAVRSWLQFDVIVQIGSRIMSKRVTQMLEERCPCPYILVDGHPYRHDPSHLLTHRVQCSVLQFSDHVIKAQFPYRRRKWCYYLQQLDKMVAREIAFQIHSKNSLTEPYVANAISKYLSADSAIFVGNSMVVRDVDMYGQNYADNAHRISEMMLHSELTCQWTRVAGNRGASGIDGLLSSAVGFAIGCGKQVLCLIGDVSFLHDTNGLTILKQRMSRKPMTILVINNQGGAIFSLLPIADGTDPGILNQFFYTSHNISIYGLCMAHGVKHLHVKTKVELQDALVMSQWETDCVVEVESCIDDNSAFHSLLRKSASRAADHALSVLSRLPISDGFFICKITKAEYCLYRIQLCAPSTLSPINHTSDNLNREGYILSVSLEDGSVGYGEVSPLEIHKENLLDVEYQLRFLVHVIQGTKISSFLPLMNGSFTSWLWNKLGIPECSIFSSVRCGLEMAILNALAVTQDSSLLCILRPLTKNEEMPERPPRVKICALVDSNGTPAEVAYIATSLIEEGFTAIKFKVARRRDPAEDAAVIQEVRKKVGKQIVIRVDANRKWTYEEAIRFGTLVKGCDLQYIEEPVLDEDDIIKYAEETGLPVALDETIDNLQENPLDMLAKYTHPGIVALVVKPSVIGGFEKAALIAQWAQQQGKMAVVSAAFESGLGLSTYVLFSHFLELQNVDLCNVIGRKVGPSIAHGLGTYRWLKQDVTCKPLKFLHDPCGGVVGACVSDATQFLQKFQIDQSIIQQNYTGEQVHIYHLTVNTNSFSCAIKVYEVGWTNHNNVVLLHGFLGTGEDWISIMKAISVCARCISFDLPGHGESKLWNNKGQADDEATLSIETISDMLYRLIQEVVPGNFTIVGYSMGARIALHMALRLSDKINGAVIISGSPGLKDLKIRKFRQAKDEARARFLITYGLGLFLDAWYAGELWESLRSHPHFKAIVTSRLLHDDVHGLARVLSDLSIGRQQPLWEDLEQCKIPVLLIVGERDGKFKEIAQRMHYVISQARKGRVRTRNNICEIAEVPKCGHAVHLENPLPVIRILRQFLTRLGTVDIA